MTRIREGERKRIRIHREEIMELRDYQKDIKGRIYAAWDAGRRSVMCQMPTGTGKTVVLVDIVEEQTSAVSKAGAMRVLVGWLTARRYWSR